MSCFYFQFLTLKYATTIVDKQCNRSIQHNLHGIHANLYLMSRQY